MEDAKLHVFGADICLQSGHLSQHRSSPHLECRVSSGCEKKETFYKVSLPGGVLFYSNNHYTCMYYQLSFEGERNATQEKEEYVQNFRFSPLDSLD